jgi:hypothetical protein
MKLKIEGVWCKTRTEFDRLSKASAYDLSISYFDVFNRLVKSDPYNKEPSDLIISLYIRKMINKAINNKADDDHLKIIYMFKDLNSNTVVNFKSFMEHITDAQVQLDLVIINRCDYPKKGVLSKFDSVRFIDND